MEGEALLLHGRLTELERKEAEHEASEEAHKKEESDYKERQLNIAARQLNTNNRLAALTLCLVVLGLIGNYISWLSADAAQKSAEAAIRAAQSADVVSDLNIDSSIRTMIEMKSQSRAMHRSAEAAVVAGQATKRQALLALQVRTRPLAWQLVARYSVNAARY